MALPHTTRSTRQAARTLLRHCTFRPAAQPQHQPRNDAPTASCHGTGPMQRRQAHAAPCCVTCCAASVLRRRRGVRTEGLGCGTGTAGRVWGMAPGRHADAAANKQTNTQTSAVRRRSHRRRPFAQSRPSDRARGRTTSRAARVSTSAQAQRQDGRLHRIHAELALIDRIHAEVHAIQAGRGALPRSRCAWRRRSASLRC